MRQVTRKKLVPILRRLLRGKVYYYFDGRADPVLHFENCSLWAAAVKGPDVQAALSWSPVSEASTPEYAAGLVAVSLAMSAAVAEVEILRDNSLVLRFVNGKHLRFPTQVPHPDPVWWGIVGRREPTGYLAPHAVLALDNDIEIDEKHPVFRRGKH